MRLKTTGYTCVENSGCKYSVNPLSAGYEQSTLAKFLRSGYSQISLTGMS